MPRSPGVHTAHYQHTSGSRSLDHHTDHTSHTSSVPAGLGSRPRYLARSQGHVSRRSRNTKIKYELDNLKLSESWTSQTGGHTLHTKNPVFLRTRVRDRERERERTECRSRHTPDTAIIQRSRMRLHRLLLRVQVSWLCGRVHHWLLVDHRQTHVPGRRGARRCLWPAEYHGRRPSTLRRRRLPRA